MRKGKKIAIIVWGLYKGGAERAAGLLSKYLSQYYQVYLFLSDINNIVYEYGGQIVYVGIDGPEYVEYNIKKYKEEYQIDCAISFLESGNFYNLKTMGRERVIISERCTSLLFDNGEIFCEKLKKEMYGKADYIVSVSEGVADELHCLYGIPRKKIKTIYNFINQDRIKTKAYVDTEGIIEDFVANSKLFVNLGRLEKQKNHVRLIHQFALLYQERQDVKLLILGSGPLQEELLNLISQLGLESCIKILPYCENPFPYMARADAYVMTSHFEGLPNAILEAMCLGTPVIAVDCFSGPRELLDGNANYREVIDGYKLCECGILVADEVSDDDGTTHLFKDAMADLLENQEYTAGVRKNEMTYMQEYTNEKILRQWIELIEKETPERSGLKEGRIERSKNIVIYGAGKYGRKILEQLQRQGYSVMAFAVTDISENPADILGIPVRNIEDFIPCKEQISIVLGASFRIQDQMIRTLKKLDFDDYKTIRLVPESNDGAM